MIGKGPLSFGQQYILYRPASVLSTGFWEVKFTQGKYLLATYALEFGILGLLGFLSIICLFLFQGFKTVILGKNSKDSIRKCCLSQIVEFLSGFSKSYSKHAARGYCHEDLSELITAPKRVLDIAKLPKAKPVALITIGAPCSRTQFNAF